MPKSKSNRSSGIKVATPLSHDYIRQELQKIITSSEFHATRQQHDFLKVAASTKDNLNLAVSECGLGINNCHVESETLAFMDCNGPGKFQQAAQIQ